MRVLILINEYSQARRHRGSSPPFLDSGRGSDDSVMRVQSNGEHEARQPAMQLEMQLGFEKTESTDLDKVSSWSKSQDPEQRSFDDGRSRQDKDDVSRWQDDGGESGEVV